MSGPVELPAELVGSAWDTPAGRAKYALLLADEPPVQITPAALEEMVRQRQVSAVARTLRWAAGHLAEEREAWDSPAVEGWTGHYREVADVLERLGLGALEGCCPACQEVGCDEDCPLAGVRS